MLPLPHQPRTSALLGLCVWSCLAPSPNAAQVHIQLIDAETGAVTPAMVCITGSDGQVRLPPDGRPLSRPSTTREFYQGIDFDPDPNWIGPVRKMLGDGDNDDRSFVYEDRPSLPFWQEPVAYQTSGAFSITLPPGTWRLAVEHGMEYIPVVLEFKVEDTPALTQTIQLKRWINLPAQGWWSGDVHVHHPTMTAAQRQFLLHYAHAADLHVVNVLEMGHHLGTDFKQAGFGPAFRVRDGNYALVSGQEEPRSTFGHIIGLNTVSLVRDVSTYDFYDLAFRRIHEQPGALVGFAHLAWNGCDLPRGFPWYVTTGELDFVELLQFSRLNSLDYYDYLNLGFRLTAAAGSDTPWGSTIGEVRTYVFTGPNANPNPNLNLDIDAWFLGLKQGRTFVSNGPVLEFSVDSELPGSELHRSPGTTLRIHARVRSHPAIGRPLALTLSGNKGVIQEVRGPSPHAELEFEFDRTIDRSQWLVLSTLCDNGAMAHTSPVYVIVGDQPTWCPDQGPDIIRKQLEVINHIAAEFNPEANPREQGIHQRLDAARKHYQTKMEAMRRRSLN